MEPKYQHTINGQSVIQADLNTMGDASSLADDRVLAELLRMAPYDGSTVSRAILPYRHASSARDGLISPNGASGNVKVNPFRALVGSRTAVATDAKKNWRDIRSAVAIGTTTLFQLASFGANSSGNPRWDLVYAQVTVDANSASVTRKVKNPTTKVITGQLVVTTVATTVSIQVLAGTAAASPQFPATPADGAGTYNIPLAYVRIPNGFGSGSTVLEPDIANVAPVMRLPGEFGPALGQNKVGGPVLGSTQVGTWGSSGSRPACFLPSSMNGLTGLFIAVDSTVHTFGAVLDERDWRNRIFRTFTAGATAPANNFQWEISTGVSSIPTGPINAAGVSLGATMGTQSIGVSPAPAFASGGSFWLVAMAGSAGNRVYVVCDPATGRLLYDEDSGIAVDSKACWWIDFSGPFENK